MKEKLIALGFLAFFIFAGSSLAADYWLYAYARDAVNSSLLTPIYACVYFANDTLAPDVFLGYDGSCVYSPSIGYVYWNLQGGETYYYSLFRLNYTTYISGPIGLNSDSNNTAYVSRLADFKTPNTVLTSNVNETTGGSFIKYRVVVNGWDEWYWNIFHNEHIGTHLTQNQSVIAVYGYNEGKGNPVFYRQQENFCAYGTFTQDTWASPIYGYSGKQLPDSNHLNILVSQPCAFTVMNCGDSICEPSRGENATSCPADCAVVTPSVCGNGLCEEAKGETNSNCPKDCSPKLNISPIVDPNSFPPETRFAAYFLSPLFFAMFSIIGIAGFIEYKAKTNGVVFSVIVVASFIIMAVAGMIPSIAVIAVGVIVAAIVAYFVTKVIRGG
jgi:hypothetical protein